MVTINYSGYELQSRKEKLETVAHFDRERVTNRNEKREEARQLMLKTD